MAVIGVVDYKAGNIKSIANAFEHLGHKVFSIQSSSDFSKVSHVVLPGVGAFGHCIEMLHKSGLLDSIHDWTFLQRKPLLGICVGMQILAERSFELGEHRGLGWISGELRRIKTPDPKTFKVPHVGWNTVSFQKKYGEFSSGDQSDFYFDHSYAWTVYSPSVALGICDHGERFLAAIASDNILATQFHPEKSQAAGLRLLKSFVVASV